MHRCTSVEPMREYTSGGPPRREFCAVLIDPGNNSQTVAPPARGVLFRQLITHQFRRGLTHYFP